MKTHEQLADELTSYALNEIAAAECAELEAHLETCASCRRELQGLRGDLGLLGLSAVGPRPPARSKDRLVNALTAEPRGLSAGPKLVETPRRNPWWMWIPALAAVLAIAAALGLWRSNRQMNDQLAELRNRYNDQHIQLTQAEENIRLFLAPDAVHVSLTPPQSSRQPNATAIVSPSQHRMTLMASALPPVPEGKAYELWIIPMEGAPMNAGVFKPDERGNAMMMNHTIPRGVQCKAFALTVEDEAGSDKPTSPVLLAGNMEHGE